MIMKKLNVSKSRLLIGGCFLLAIVTLFNNCSKSSSTGGTNQGANEVFIQGMAFNPTTITVTVGTTVTWTNKDGVAHTVTSNTGAFDSGSVNPNGTYSHMFSLAGTFPYKCTIHPTMTATVIVN
jgi:plastocyanin